MEKSQFPTVKQERQLTQGRQRWEQPNTGRADSTQPQNSLWRGENTRKLHTAGSAYPVLPVSMEKSQIPTVKQECQLTQSRQRWEQPNTGRADSTQPQNSLWRGENTRKLHTAGSAYPVLPVSMEKSQIPTVKQERQLTQSLQRWEQPNTGRTESTQPQNSLWRGENTRKLHTAGSAYPVLPMSMEISQFPTVKQERQLTQSRQRWEQPNTGRADSTQPQNSLWRGENTRKLHTAGSAYPVLPVSMEKSQFPTVKQNASSHRAGNAGNNPTQAEQRALNHKTHFGEEKTPENCTRLVQLIRSYQCLWKNRNSHCKTECQLTQSRQRWEQPNTGRADSTQPQNSLWRGENTRKLHTAGSAYPVLPMSMEKSQFPTVKQERQLTQSRQRWEQPNTGRAESTQPQNSLWRGENCTRLVQLIRSYQCLWHFPQRVNKR